MLEWSYNDSYLNILAAHPRRRDLKLFSQHYVGLAGSASAPGYQEQFKDFSAQLAARLPDVQPDDSDLWPSDGRLGVGATWATSLSDEMLTRVLGHYRIVPADS